jgi:hypothetical protein
MLFGKIGKKKLNQSNVERENQKKNNLRNSTNKEK